MPATLTPPTLSAARSGAVSDAEMLLSVRQAILRISGGSQSYSIDGIEYRSADLAALRVLEQDLANRVAASGSGTGGGVRTYQVVF